MPVKIMITTSRIDGVWVAVTAAYSECVGVSRHSSARAASICRAAVLRQIATNIDDDLSAYASFDGVVFEVRGGEHP